MPFTPADDFLSQLRDEAEAQNIKSKYYHHPKRCGKLRNITVRKGTGVNQYYIRLKRCKFHEITICHCGFERGLHFDSVSQSMNPTRH